MKYKFNTNPDPVNNKNLNRHIVQHRSRLSDKEIMAIREIGDQLEKTGVTLFNATEETQKRVNATGSHFEYNKDTHWVFERVGEIVKEINNLWFQYDLDGFNENFYYLSYGDDQFFNWHLDIGPRTSAPRKLSCVLQLSDPEEYEGGFLDIMIGDESTYARAERQKGLVIAFPSYKIHRVTPVTSGKRRSLAIFCHGPNFR